MIRQGWGAIPIQNKRGEILIYQFTINGTMPNLNDLIQAERQQIRVAGKFTTKGNDLKQQWQNVVIWQIRQQLRDLCISKPIHIKYCFIEPNKKRDKDNIASFAMKIVQDALVKAGTLKNDGWAQITGFSCEFDVDKNNPRIEIQLVECD